jgi:putative prophage lambdaLm01, holin
MERLQEAWAFKACSSCVIAIVSHTHFQMFMAFGALVFIDFFTKLLALSRQHLIDHGRKKIHFWTCLKNVRKARRARYIRSGEMRIRFTAKMLMYLGLVAAARLVDLLCASSGAPTIAVVVVVGYLAMTELLSILENMEQSGVKEAAELHELIRKKSGFGVKKEG